MEAWGFPSKIDSAAISEREITNGKFELEGASCQGHHICMTLRMTKQAGPDLIIPVYCSLDQVPYQ